MGRLSRAWRRVTGRPTAEEERQQAYRGQQAEARRDNSQRAVNWRKRRRNSGGIAGSLGGGGGLG